MKISKSKQELARIISENGGWRDERNHAVQDKEDRCVWFIDEIQGRDQGMDFWNGSKSGRIKCDKLLPNWHQTILSREEYFHLYPALEAKPEFCESVTRSIPEPESKPTIEQLAADYRNLLDYAERKQTEADAARADAEAKLKEIELAGESLGLIVTPTTAKRESGLEITDWRDLQVGDIIQCVGNWEKEKTDGMQLPVTKLRDPHYKGNLPIRVEVPGISCPGTWGINFKFIRRP